MSSERTYTHSGTRSGARAGAFGAAALGLDLANDAVLGSVRDVHTAVVRRINGVTDLVGGHRTRVDERHLGIAGAAYAGVGSGLRLVASGLRAVDRAGLTAPLESTPRGRFVISALNGLFGDRIREDHPGLAIDMALRLRGRDVAPTRAGLATAYPQATGDLVVFLHGLSETEDYWRRRADETGGSYGDRLRDDAGWTPLYVRANSGLTLAENGVELAGLLDAVLAGWSVPVRRIALVGHSMGGLIARAACVVDTDADPAWTDLVSDVVTLGTPHLGAPIARALTAGSSGLGRLPESAPFGRFLDHRSAGILDLRDGLPRDVRHLPHARYHLVAATVTRSPWHPVAEVAGDGFVRYPSALGRPRRGREMFPGADVLHVRGAHHFDLLNHEEVYAALRTWLPRAAT